MNHEQQIRDVIADWVEDTKKGRKDDVLRHHTTDAVIYDPLPPLRYLSAEDYRKSFDIWWPETTGDGLFDLQDLQIFAGEDTAFAHAILRCGGTHIDGEAFEDLVRLTICFRRLDDRWRITHQHTSMPMQMSDTQ
jgi:ketosteroid isomerase-like protein